MPRAAAPGSKLRVADVDSGVAANVPPHVLFRDGERSRLEESAASTASGGAGRGVSILIFTSPFERGLGAVSYTHLTLPTKA